jgi:cholesterol oxidase
VTTIETDVLVVGSGFGAAAPALRLAKAGLQVLMVEKGRDIVPARDFHHTQDPKYLQTYLHGSTGKGVSFTWAEGLGGGSGFYEMVSLRAPAKAFDQTDVRGRRLWPAGLDRGALDPGYDEAERMLRVSQIAPDRLPRSGVAFSQLMKNLGYSCDRARYAVVGCVGSGYCVTGCPFGAKQSLHLNYLPAAKAAGMRVLTDLEALDVRLLERDPSRTRGRPVGPDLPFRYEVRCRGARGAEDALLRAKVLVLGGGTVGTARLLMASARHLPRLGPHVGRNIAVNGMVKAVGILPDGFVEGDMVSGMSHPGVISYQFWDSLGITLSAAKPLPLQLVASARLSVRGATHGPLDWGEAHVGLMRQYRRRMIVLYALGLTPPAAWLERKPNGDLEPRLAVDDDLEAYHARTKGLLHDVLERNGCRIVDVRLTDLKGEPHPGIHFDTTHMTGSCRMADSPRDGVVDAAGEAFHYPGLHVTDGAAVPSSLGVNSSLTILANAERIGALLAHRLAPRATAAAG